MSIVGMKNEKMRKEGLMREEWLKKKIGKMIEIWEVRRMNIMEFEERKEMNEELKKINDECRGDIGIGRFEKNDMVERKLNEFLEGR